MTPPRLALARVVPLSILILLAAGTSCASPTVIYFNATGTTNWTVPEGVTAVDYLVVGGGGGGGTNGGGGGGAGGVVTGALLPVSGSVTVVVGAGGAGSTSSNAPGQNGMNSSFGTIVARGGGGGGSGNSVKGLSGGSGGGASATGIPGAGISGQGNWGGYGDTPGGSQRYWGGGGGGAGSAGGNATKNANGGAGGDGIVSSITGVALAYGGGGGGGGDSGIGGTGGTGGGGTGGIGANPGSDGLPNTGGGGGGGGTTGRGGAGGSGVVIIRYVLPAVTNLTPAEGPLEGGTNVTITGSGFTGVTAVRFGSTPAPSYTLVSDSTIFATSPPGSVPGTVNVTVTTPYGTSIPGPGSQFTYAVAHLEIDVNGTISNWTLSIGENIDATSLTLKVISTHGWSVSVYDALDLGKPASTAGHMAEFNGFSYNSSGRMLSRPVQLKDANATSFVTLTGVPQQYLSGGATPAGGTVYPVVVRQEVEYEDHRLTPPSVYQVIVTFVGTTL
ncbi:MAG: IPT/TIG domain-containing protein [Methanolinea sp.]|nr:IPT/TIG domain-containing protein [Methanolinea sp.]